MEALPRELEERALRIIPANTATQARCPAETGLCIQADGITVLDMQSRRIVDQWRWENIRNIIGHTDDHFGALKTFELENDLIGKLTFACADLANTLHALGSGKALKERSAGEFFVYTWQDPGAKLPAELFIAPKQDSIYLLDNARLSRWEWSQIKAFHIHKRDDPTDMEIFSIDIFSHAAVAQSFEGLTPTKSNATTFAFECDDAYLIREACTRYAPAHTQTTSQADTLMKELLHSEQHQFAPAATSTTAAAAAVYSHPSAMVVSNPAVEVEMARLEQMIQHHQNQQQSLQQTLDQHERSHAGAINELVTGFSKTQDKLTNMKSFTDFQAKELAEKEQDLIVKTNTVSRTVDDTSREMQSAFVTLTESKQDDYYQSELKQLEIRTDDAAHTLQVGAALGAEEELVRNLNARLQRLEEEHLLILAQRGLEQMVPGPQQKQKQQQQKQQQQKQEQQEQQEQQQQQRQQTQPLTQSAVTGSSPAPSDSSRPKDGRTASTASASKKSGETTVAPAGAAPQPSRPETLRHPSTPPLPSTPPHPSTPPNTQHHRFSSFPPSHYATTSSHPSTPPNESTVRVPMPFLPKKGDAGTNVAGQSSSSSSAKKQASSSSSSSASHTHKKSQKQQPVAQKDHHSRPVLQSELTLHNMLDIEDLDGMITDCLSRVLNIPSNIVELVTKRAMHEDLEHTPEGNPAFHDSVTVAYKVYPMSETHCELLEERMEAADFGRLIGKQLKILMKQYGLKAKKVKIGGSSRTSISA